jgi:hypothetical protein
MAITFDGTTKVIQLDTSVTVSVQDMYSRWKDWVLLNPQYPAAFRTVGGDPTVGGNRIATYYFLTNGWRVRPASQNYTLTVDGILLVDGGGDPYLSALGTWNVRIVATIPLQAEAVIVETGVSGLTSAESAMLSGIDALIQARLDAAISSRLAATEAAKLDQIRSMTNLIPAAL